MQHTPENKELDHWPDDFEVSAASRPAEGDPWTELVEARESLQAAREKEARLLQLLADARELLLEFQSQTAAAEARASEAERRAEAAEALLNPSRAPEPHKDDPNNSLDFYTGELNRLRALMNSEDGER